MSSQRHKREHDFFRVANSGTQTGELTGPKEPEDANDEKASQWDEVPAWPTGARPTPVP